MFGLLLLVWLFIVALDFFVVLFRWLVVLIVLNNVYIVVFVCICSLLVGWIVCLDCFVCFVLWLYVLLYAGLVICVLVGCLIAGLRLCIVFIGLPCYCSLVTCCLLCGWLLCCGCVRCVYDFIC